MKQVIFSFLVGIANGLVFVLCAIVFWFMLPLMFGKSAAPAAGFGGRAMIILVLFFIGSSFIGSVFTHVNLLRKTGNKRRSPVVWWFVVFALPCLALWLILPDQHPAKTMQSAVFAWVLFLFMGVVLGGFLFDKVLKRITMSKKEVLKGADADNRQKNE